LRELTEACTGFSPGGSYLSVLVFSRELTEARTGFSPGGSYLSVGLVGRDGLLWLVARSISWFLKNSL